MELPQLLHAQDGFVNSAGADHLPYQLDERSHRDGDDDLNRLRKQWAVDRDIPLEFFGKHLSNFRSGIRSSMALGKPSDFKCLSDRALSFVLRITIVPVLPGCRCSRDEVRCNDADEFAGCDHLGFLPESRKMPLVPGHQVVGAYGIGAFNELVIVGIARHLQCPRWLHQPGVAPDELEKLLPGSLADLQLRAGEHLAVLNKYSGGHVERCRFGDRQDQDGALESVRFEGCRDNDVGVDHQPERDHPRLDLAARADLITSSICREVSLSVPWRFDSSPMMRSTSGSGAARRT